MDAQRARPVRMTCVCRLRWDNRYDSCGVVTSGTDEPVCRYCIASGHDRMPEFDPTVKERRHAGATVHIV